MPLFTQDECRGIKRSEYPQWKGWRIIDKLKIIYRESPKQLPYAIAGDVLLNEYVKDFYKEHKDAQLSE